MKKIESVQEFVEKLDAAKKVNPKDLSSDQDLTIGIMNLISIEEHLMFSGAKTGKTQFYDLINEVREMRKNAMMKIILPQAIKNSLPSICNEFIINIKDTSVLSVIAVMDLFFVIDTINGRYANNDGVFIAAIIYLCLTFGISKLLGLIEKKMNLVSKPLPSCN